MKSGFVGIIGRPNVGKSTLLNALLGEKVAITADKPQTTRNTIRGIYTDEDCQLVFLDTPGIHKPRTKLGLFMTDSALRTLEDVDAILFMLDGSGEGGPGDRYILEQISKVETPAILVINKTDLIDPETYKGIYESYEASGRFTAILGVSALKGQNTGTLLSMLKDLMAEGPQYFPGDMVTDHPERFLASEIIREKLLHYLEEEIPHGVAVEIESFKEDGALTRIGAVIYCEKKSHKGIIIGKNGRKLKGVGKSAREELESLLGTKVYLELWVKVKENWRDSDAALSSFGYKE